ncbi:MULTISPECIES: ATP-dependent DNA helicase RecG [unclassified Breznakia]|uniref:ATP-dependent DNA helicase RecG n=1 Tax=unclassified Breznakia TaxID=2623764 RepID=UPI0024736825|nr:MULTISPECIES: ATP-dependent DNA helicase RecG [unclassified Breznakia]MDH6366964.1 ATP-dependent DNA helicase RecG [Breznakia sp. PH1-1]MDH6404142.1 ATP-dependent DNA helicase RecG [Breznakia sp. PF1-11]MDH6411851.1 ATP-dependent DNA helicase RecG [Breznakia sp. PFB1-11]MDH6414130.1 ATP-dependent DNA helicase RecG [Breznakia sp. PFB1-14]MDH6416513.1 ATP-dependent DNA helicase RecG [Breznakia sp. PFB1-4]
MDLKSIKVTPKKREILQLMHIDSVEDLLVHYPFRYEDQNVKPFADWLLEEKVFFSCTIINQAKVQYFGGKRSVTRFKAMYDEEELSLTLFNRPWISAFRIGHTITVSGKYQGNGKVLVMSYNTQPIEEQLGIIPVYNTKDGLSQKDLRKYLANALDSCMIEEFIPDTLKETYKLVSRKQALHDIHFPKNYESVKQAIRYLKYEEFLKFQLTIQYYKMVNVEKSKVAKVFAIDKVEQLIQGLPYMLTDDQRQAISETLADLQSTHIMYRLVQGDVGSGKTIVATIAMYANTLTGMQSALLAPTEILAKQHYANVERVLKPYGVRVGLLYSALPAKEKHEIIDAIAAGDMDVIIGTHALFQEAIQYKNLGLVIADEQHRFGVEQRRKLIEKGNDVDFLLMSATPIPRTLATSLYGDMDVSSIEQMPAGRKPSITKLIKESSIRSIMGELKDLLDAGNQCYIVCPAIEKNNDLKLRNVEEIYHNLLPVLGKMYHLDYLHGKMSSEQKDEIMQQFKRKEIDILIATSVIEVGVDVPDANIMIIYDAERFGLSQIHQLRGRIGRAGGQGYCYLLSNSKDPDSIRRMEILCESNDGFEIAKQDLMIRGPGDLLGSRQSGIPGFILGDVIMDENILEVAKKDALVLLQHLDNYPNIARYVKEKEYTSTMD